MLNITRGRRSTRTSWDQTAALLVVALMVCVALAVYVNFAVVLAALAIGFLLVVFMPTTAVMVSVSWILLVRPNAKLFQSTIAGFNVTEVDVLILLALVAGSRIPRRSDTFETRSLFSDWIPLLAWPIWMLLRALIPQIGSVLFGSPLVDLRILSSFLLIFPLWAIASRLGGDALLKLICYSAYAACAIAVVAWLMVRLNLVQSGSYPLVNLASGAAQDVRPGGEVLIPILAVLLVFNQAPLLLQSRWLSFLLLFGEILVSQTLSIVIASAAGVALALVMNWRHTSWAKRSLIMAFLVGSAFTAVSGAGVSSSSDADVSSRFNLAQRIGQTSAQYRVAEFETLAGVFRDDPLVLAIGTGPGSLVAFNNGLMHEVKNLTHNVYNNLILKTGLVGLVLFTGGFLLTFLRHWGKSGVLVRALAGSFGAIGVLSMTVPFASTVSGLAGLLGLGTLAVWHTAQARSVVAGTLN
jgi:O-antigen ligase